MAGNQNLLRVQLLTEFKGSDKGSLQVGIIWW